MIKSPYRWRRACAVALSVAVCWLTPTSSLAAPRPADRGPLVEGQQACDASVAPDQETIDGSAKAFADIVPGSVVCLPAGTRPNLRIRNFNGAPGKPITIRNDGGRVRITGTNLGDGGFLIQSSTFLRLSGAGSESHCGAEFDPDDQRCGFVIDGAVKGIKIDTTKGPVGDIEIDHVEVLRVSRDKKTRGISIHPVPGLIVSGIHIHHNHVVDTLGEGIYVGTEPHGQPFESLAKVQRVEVDHNLVERTGYDGIKVKVGISEIAVHDNVIRDAGQLRDGAHQGGIKLALSVGDYYNNTIIGGVEGIRMGRDLDRPGTRYFNNVVIGVLNVGIEASEDGARIYNNTIVASEDVGIKATGAGTFIADNIVSDTRRPFIVRDGQQHRNLVLTADEVGFVDATAGDYRLLDTSPAVDAGVVFGVMPCAADDHRPTRVSRRHLAPRGDRDGLARPSGCRSDLGAFERSGTAIASHRPSILP